MNNPELIDDGIAGSYPDGLYHHTGIVQGVSTFNNIGEREVSLFHEQGFLVVEQAFTELEVETVLAALVDLLHGSNPDFHGIQYEESVQDQSPGLNDGNRQDHVRKFMSFANYDARLSAFSLHPALLSVVNKLMNATPELLQDMALIKPPRIGREKPWHQDMAYFDLPINTLVIGVWIALDAATTENGCMIIAPGSHREPIVHFQRRDWQICDTYAPHRRPVAVPLKPGGCLFFHALLQHGTAANQSPNRRRAVQFHYKPANTIATTREARMAIFGDEGKDVEC